jgi:predicted esterase
LNWPIAALGSAIILAACGVGGTPPGTPSQTSASTAPQTRSPAPQSTTPSPTPVSWPTGVVAYLVGSGNGPLPYLEYLPAGYGEGAPRPLLVFLHGVDETANGTEQSLFKILGLGIPRLIADGEWPAQREFVVLMPQEPWAKPQRRDFGAEIGEFLDFAIERYSVDRKRVYLTGISCGAIGVWDYLASSTRASLAAAIPISGHPVWAMEKAGCAVGRVPTWVFHGASDVTVPVEYVEDAIAKIRSCTDPAPSELDLTVYPDADHDAWTRTYDLSAGHDVYAWLLAHSRP